MDDPQNQQEPLGRLAALEPSPEVVAEPCDAAPSVQEPEALITEPPVEPDVIDEPEVAPASAEASPPAPEAVPPGEIHYYVNPTYVELPVGEDGGVMRADVGDYVVTTDTCTVVMPPSVFAEAYPDLVA